MKNELAQKLVTKRVKDYSYVAIFFLIFAFFVFFAIRPNLTTVFSLQKELTELKKLDANYELAIKHVIDIQRTLETYRTDYHLLAEALPATPQVNKVIDDLHLAASSSGMVMKRIDIDEVNLKEIQEKKLRQFTVNLQTDSDFVTVRKFFDGLVSQRRLKTIDSLSIKRDPQSSGSASLKIQFDINGYYL